MLKIGKIDFRLGIVGFKSRHQSSTAFFMALLLGSAV